MENTHRAPQGLSGGVFVGSSRVYLGDPPVPVWGQSFTGATGVIIQSATRWSWHTQLGAEQHFIMAVAFGQLWQTMALPVTGTRETKWLAAGFGRQLVTGKREERLGTPLRGFTSPQKIIWALFSGGKRIYCQSQQVWLTWGGQFSFLSIVFQILLSSERQAFRAKALRFRSTSSYGFSFSVGMM